MEPAIYYSARNLRVHVQIILEIRNNIVNKCSEDYKSILLCIFQMHTERETPIRQVNDKSLGPAIQRHQSNVREINVLCLTQKFIHISTSILLGTKEFFWAKCTNKWDKIFIEVFIDFKDAYIRTYFVYSNSQLLVCYLRQKAKPLTWHD